MDPLDHWPAIPSPSAVPARRRYPVDLVVLRSRHASRVTTMFRAVLVLPHIPFSICVELVGAAVVALGWAWGSITGRVPGAVRRYMIWLLRYRAGVDCYAVLLTDRFPPFSGTDDPAAPIRVIASEAEPQPRWSVFLRAILVLPVLFISVCLVFVLMMVAVAAWSAIIVAGQLPSTVADVLEMASGFILRTRAYLALVTAAYPWFEHDAPDER